MLKKGDLSENRFIMKEKTEQPNKNNLPVPSEMLEQLKRIAFIELDGAISDIFINFINEIKKGFIPKPIAYDEVSRNIAKFVIAKGFEVEKLSFHAVDRKPFGKSRAEKKGN